MADDLDVAKEEIVEMEQSDSTEDLSLTPHLMKTMN